MLCKLCQDVGYKNIDRLEHHENFAALVISANEGCELCLGFVNFMESNTITHEGDRMSFAEFTQKMGGKNFLVDSDPRDGILRFYCEFGKYGSEVSCVEAEIFDEPGSFYLSIFMDIA